VNEPDLAKAIKDGYIAGAGLDVFVDEPNVPVELMSSDSVVLQAHRASATWETRTAMGEMVLEALASGIAGLRPQMSLTT
jgi:lactate dehydrogenase-like 2-hydroxyacid dehydrogenase